MLQDEGNGKFCSVEANPVNMPGQHSGNVAEGHTNIGWKILAFLSHIIEYSSMHGHIFVTLLHVWLFVEKCLEKETEALLNCENKVSYLNLRNY